jgi:MFS family permease
MDRMSSVPAATQPRLASNRDFRRWFLSRSVSVAGTAASTVALPVLVYQITGSAALTAAVVGLEAAPYLVFGLFFGALADRLPRRPAMVRADLVNASLVATIPVADAFGVLTASHLLAVAFGIGVGFCWFDSAAWGALPRLVGKARLPEANSLIWSTSVVISIVAPAATGAFMAATRPSLVLAVDAASYLVSAVLIASVRTPLTPDRGQRVRLAADVTAGLRFIWHQPVIRALTFTGFLIAVAGGGTLGLLVVHADQALGVGRDDGRIGLLYTASAVGGLLAAMLLPRTARRVGEGAVSVAGYALFAAATVLLAIAASPVVGLASWVLWEYAYATSITNGINVRQQLTPDDMQGRVNTTGRMIAWGGTPFGALVGGLVAQTTNARIAYTVLTLPVAVGLVLLLASPVRTLRVTTEG